jgi:integrase
MMHAAEHDRFRTATDRATLFRDGLIISILALTLLRLANLTSITVGQHLTRRGDHWHLSFEPASTKGGRRMEFRFPDRLVPSLTRYVDKHRPMLLKCTRKPLPPTDALFISQHGTHMTTGAVALQVKARTLEAFGVAINPHAFRHAGVTTYVTTNPGGASDIKYLLGHTSEPTGEKYYNKAKIVDAAQRYQETIHAKLRQLKLGLD